MPFNFLKDFSISPLRLTLLTLGIFLLVTVYQRHDGYATYGFAEEIGNVAASVATGNGFANTFSTDSGPTAWCPPLYVVFYAGLFKIFGVKSHAAYWALYVSRAIILSLALFLLLRINYPGKLNDYKLLLFPIFTVYGLLVVITKKCDDVFLHIFMSAFILFTFSNLLDSKERKRTWLLYGLSFIAPYTNISFFGTVVLLVLMGQALKYWNLQPRQLIIVGALLISGVLVWGVRNQQALGAFIPFKSNLWFEVYLANVVDDDGISKWSNFRKYHPLGNPEVLDQYNQLGEVAFIDQYKSGSLDYLQRYPDEFVAKVGHRLKEAFWFTTSQMDTDLAALETFNTYNLEKLRAENLIKMDLWVCLEDEPEQFMQKINSLALVNEEPILEDWMKKQRLIKTRIEGKDSLKNLLRTYLISLVPALMLLMGLLVSGIRNNKLFLLTVVCYLMSVGPYILVSFLPRYQFFQMTFQVMLVFFGLSFLLSKMKIPLPRV